MAPFKSALLEILDAAKEGNVAERVRESATTIYQALPVTTRSRPHRALIEAELPGVIGAEPHEAPIPVRGNATDIGPRVSTTAGDRSCGSRSCAPVVLPVAVGAPTACQPGLVRGDHGGVPAPSGTRAGRAFIRIAARLLGDALRSGWREHGGWHFLPAASRVYVRGW
jgi:hypothetical protein